MSAQAWIEHVTQHKVAVRAVLPNVEPYHVHMQIKTRLLKLRSAMPFFGVPRRPILPCHVFLLFHVVSCSVRPNTTANRPHQTFSYGSDERTSGGP